MEKTITNKIGFPVRDHYTILRIISGCFSPRPSRRKYNAINLRREITRRLTGRVITQYYISAKYEQKCVIFVYIRIQVREVQHNARLRSIFVRLFYAYSCLYANSKARQLSLADTIVVTAVWIEQKFFGEGWANENERLTFANKFGERRVNWPSPDSRGWRFLYAEKNENICSKRNWPADVLFSIENRILRGTDIIKRRGRTLNDRTRRRGTMRIYTTGIHNFTSDVRLINQSPPARARNNANKNNTSSIRYRCIFYETASKRAPPATKMCAPSSRRFNKTVVA